MLKLISYITTYIWDLVRIEKFSEPMYVEEDMYDPVYILEYKAWQKKIGGEG